MDNTDAILLSALSGAGLYGGTRLLHNAMNKIDGAGAPAEHHGVGGDKIIIKLPKKHDPNAPQQPEQHKIAEMTAAAIPLSIAAFAASMYGANKLHDNFQKGVAKKDLDDAHAKYNEYLQKIQNQKTASNTPVVDAMCEKFAAELDKTADITSSVKDFFPTFPWNQTPGGHDQWSRYETEIPGVHQAAEGAKGMGMDKIVMPIAGVLGTYGALKFLADRTKNKREEDAAAKHKLPTQVVIDQS